MGLDVGYDAFSGAYSAFNRFRQAVCKAVGGSFPPHDREDLDRNMYYLGEGYDTETHVGLAEFLSHSDCDGEISPEMCVIVANELEALLPKIEEIERKEPAVGHLARDGGYVTITKRFIEGCRAAAADGVPLEFR